MDKHTPDWLETLFVAAVDGWKRRIRRRLEDEGIRSQEWEITDAHDPEWIRDILCPLLRREGLIVTYYTGSVAPTLYVSLPGRLGQ